MRYMLLMHGIEADEDSAVDNSAVDNSAVDNSAVAEEPDEPCYMPWLREMTAHGGIESLNGAQLQPSRTATTVRANGSEVLVADGPFAETKEQILGFDVIECANLDEAIYAASRHPVAQSGGVVEVRPVRAM